MFWDSHPKFLKTTWQIFQRQLTKTNRFCKILRGLEGNYGVNEKPTLPEGLKPRLISYSKVKFSKAFIMLIKIYFHLFVL